MNTDQLGNSKSLWAKDAIGLNLDTPLGSPDKLLMGEARTRQNEAHLLSSVGILESKKTNASDLEVEGDRASVDQTLEEGLQAEQESLRNFATDSDFLSKMRLAFSDDFDVEIALSTEFHKFVAN
jgi:hypothetical protein